MQTVQLKTDDPRVVLVPPDIARDAPVSVEWLDGRDGRETLHLMGVTDEDNQASNLQAEEQRVRDFISRTDQLHWTILYQDRPIGAPWVDLEASDYLPAPSIHIMIGDPDMRGHGIGGATMQAVIDHLRHEDHKNIYSRHVTDNIGSAKLLEQLGFQIYGTIYSDDDGLQWQNVSLTIRE